MFAALQLHTPRGSPPQYKSVDDRPGSDTSCIHLPIMPAPAAKSPTTLVLAGGTLVTVGLFYALLKRYGAGTEAWNYSNQVQDDPKASRKLNNILFEGEKPKPNAKVDPKDAYAVTNK